MRTAMSQRPTTSQGRRLLTRASLSVMAPTLAPWRPSASAHRSDLHSDSRWRSGYGGAAPGATTPWS